MLGRLQRIAQDHVTAAAWIEAKQALLAQMAADGFGERPGRQVLLLDIERRDRCEAVVLGAHSLPERLLRGVSQSRHSKQIAQRLGLQLQVSQWALRYIAEQRPNEVLLCVEPSTEGSVNERALGAWCERLLTMYIDSAKRRHMQIMRHTPTPVTGAGSLPILEIAGYGACAVLRNEAGLHLLEQAAEGGATRATDRLNARVRVVAGRPPDARDVRNVISSSSPEVRIVRRYREAPSPLVRDSAVGWRSGRLNEVLGGDFDLIGQLNDVGH